MIKIRELLKKIIYKKDCKHYYIYYSDGDVRRRKCKVCGDKYAFNSYYKRWRRTF